MRKNPKGASHSSSKSVYQFKDDKFIAEYGSIGEAERETGVCASSISAVCKGKRKSAGGYVWGYA